MTVTNLVFVTKKPEQSFDEFIQYYETVHIPLMHRHLGDTLPKSFRRFYTDSATSTYIGPSRGIDLIIEMAWEDEVGVGRFMARLAEGGNAELMQDSWVNYCDEKGETVVGVGRVFGS